MLKDQQDKYSIRGCEDVKKYLETCLSSITDPQKEHFIALALNTRNQIIASEVISIGHLTGSLVHPREVFRFAILNNANSIIMAHNHPSGDPQPSRADDEITKSIKEAGACMWIPLTDHIIFCSCNSEYYSYNKEGRL